MSAPVSPEALQRAWQAMRQRACMRHWPQDFDQVMADPVRSRLVRMEALHNLQPHRPAPVAIRRAAVLPTLTAPPFFDHKRAAAGDRDD
jgi:hypothetical protein